MLYLEIELFERNGNAFLLYCELQRPLSHYQENGMCPSNLLLQRKARSNAHSLAILEITEPPHHIGAASIFYVLFNCVGHLYRQYDKC